MARIDFPVIIAIVQARMGSTRLPGKMLMDLGGRTLLEWTLLRLKSIRMLHQVVLASPDRELIAIADKCGCWGYQDTGDPNNVLSRYIKAANWCNAEIVVRVCGDCPLIDPEIVENTINGYLENRVDISTNVLRRTFAKGMDVEVLHRNVLKRILHLTDDLRMREHVTLYAYENQPLFKFHNISDTEDLSWLNASIDTKSDLDRISKMVSNLGTVYHNDTINLPYSEIKRYLRSL
jgi:spore coat polysaccharide biosynthesis protein SpsF (cytidylyltransferase family)